MRILTTIFHSDGDKRAMRKLIFTALCAASMSVPAGTNSEFEQHGRWFTQKFDDPPLTYMVDVVTKQCFLRDRGSLSTVRINCDRLYRSRAWRNVLKETGMDLSCLPGNREQERDWRGYAPLHDPCSDR